MEAETNVVEKEFVRLAEEIYPELKNRAAREGHDVIPEIPSVVLSAQLWDLLCDWFCDETEGDPMKTWDAEWHRYFFHLRMRLIEKGVIGFNNVPLFLLKRDFGI